MRSLLKPLIWTLGVGLLALGGLLFDWQSLLWTSVLTSIVTVLFVVYVPGYWLSRCFFSQQQVKGWERVMMSCALGILWISLVVFYLHYFAREVYPLHVYLCTLGCIVILFVYLLVRE